MSPIEDGPLLLRVGEVQAALSCGRDQVYGLIRSGELPSIRLGRRLLVPRKAIEAWVERVTGVNGQSEPGP